MTRRGLEDQGLLLQHKTHAAVHLGVYVVGHNVVQIHEPRAEGLAVSKETGQLEEVGSRHQLKDVATIHLKRQLYVST